MTTNLCVLKMAKNFRGHSNETISGPSFRKTKKLARSQVTGHKALAQQLRARKSPPSWSKAISWEQKTVGALSSNLTGKGILSIYH